MNSRVRCRTVTVAVALLLSGCQSYRSGSLMHPQVRSVALGVFENRTDQPDAGTVVRGAVARQFTADGSVRLADRRRADTLLVGRVLAFRTERVAVAKRRSERDRDRDEYQSTLFRAQLTVEFELHLSSGRTVLDTRQVVGETEFSPLPDLSVARREALRHAANAVAVKLVAGVTEAW